MSKKLPIFYSALLLTGVNLLLRLISTSFQVYLSGRIGAAGIGLLQLVMSVGAMSMTAGMAGIRTTAMYLCAEELGKRRPGNIHWVLCGCARYSLICSGGIGLLIYVLAPRLAVSWIGDLRTLGALRMLALFLPVTCLCGVMSGYFTAANRIGTLAAIQILEQMSSMGITLVALKFWAGDDPGRCCQAVVLGSCIGACLTLGCLTVLRWIQREKHGAPTAVSRHLLQTAVPLALADDLKAGITTAENLMVPKRLARYAGAWDSLALFGTISGMVFPVMMFPAAILFGLAELLIPELARCHAAGSQKRIDYLVRRSLRIALLYGCMFWGVLFLSADALCRVLYGNTEAGRFLRWFSFAVPMLYCDAITDAMIKGLGQQKFSVRYNILTSAMDVVLLYLLLPHWGIAGYFSSFFVTHLINFALSLQRLLKITGRHISLQTPLRSILAVAGAIGLSCSLQNPVLRCGVYFLLCGCLFTLLDVLSREDIRWVRRLFRTGE